MTPATPRRDLLRGIAAGGLAAVGPLAGCTSRVATTDNHPARPSYHRYVPAAAGPDGTFFVGLDFDRLEGLGTTDPSGILPPDANVSFSGERGLENTDPVLAYPAAGLFIGIFGLSFGLVSYGFRKEVIGGITSGRLGTATATPGPETEATSSGPARVDLAVMVSDAFVFEGSFDTTALAEAAPDFEPAGKREGFALYEGTGDGSGFDTEDLAFAVDDRRLVTLSGQESTGDPRARLDGILDVVLGETDRLSGNAAADWALRTAGEGLVALGAWGVQATGDGTNGSTTGVQVESVLQGADGLVSSLDVADGRATSVIAAVFPDGETPARSAIVEEIGRSVSDTEVTIDGRRVAVTAGWPAGDGSVTDTR